MTERDVQDYTSIYLDLADKYRRESKEKEDICDDIVFETELVKQVEVNIDYILFLVEKYQASHQANLEIRTKIQKAIDSSPDLRDKKELIEKFIDSLTPGSSVDGEWKEYVNEQKREQFNQIISEKRAATVADYLKNRGVRINSWKGVGVNPVTGRAAVVKTLQ